MSPKWIKSWINDTIRRNPEHNYTKHLNELKQKPYPDMLAAVVRVNVHRKSWQFKLTVNKFDWGTKKLDWSTEK